MPASMIIINYLDYDLRRDYVQAYWLSIVRIEIDRGISHIEKGQSNNTVAESSPLEQLPKRRRLANNIANGLSDTVDGYISDVQTSSIAARNNTEHPDPTSGTSVTEPVNGRHALIIEELSHAESSARADLQAFDLSLATYSEQQPTVNPEESTFPPMVPFKPIYVHDIPDSITKEYYELYLDQFHHRWPIIHIPTVEKGGNPYVLSASIEMIGAWLAGTCESKNLSLTLHDRLTNHIFQRMVCFYFCL